MKIIKNRRDFSEHAKYMLSLAIGLTFIGFAMPGFYFEKPGAFAHIIFFSLLGLMEREKGERS